jgi:hypothetical protein
MSDDATNSIPVIWLITAQDQLENAFSQAKILVGQSHEAQRQRIEEEITRVDNLLRRSFEHCQSIVVLERLGGYSFKPDFHVLRVEVKTPDAADGSESPSACYEAREHEHVQAKRPTARTEAHVVKIGPCDQLCREVIGRETCERPANARGRTLLKVRLAVCPHGSKNPQYPCSWSETGKDGRKELGTIKYQDAYHTLRAGRVVMLERAFLNCVRWGTPSPQTILGVLDQVYQELHNLCYERAPAVLPNSNGRDILARLRERLKKGVARWKDTSSIPGERRVQARELLPADVLPLVDPIDFQSRMFRQPHYQPELRYGRAHGDLHARNIVVGLVNGEACWPAVYDFEDMAVDNYVAWDFVKLETELKVRALKLVFPGAPEKFVPEVFAFEQRLNELTEVKDQESFESWQDEPASGLSDAQARLLGLLLGLRRRAKRYLQILGPARTYRWLHEYYFFLACYGVYAGRFEQYTGKECLAAYLGACCAATRFSWGVECVYLSREDGKALAQQQLDVGLLFPGGPPNGPPSNPTGAVSSPPTPESPANPSLVLRIGKEITVRCSLSLGGRGWGEGPENATVISLPILTDQVSTPAGYTITVSLVSPSSAGTGKPNTQRNVDPRSRWDVQLEKFRTLARSRKDTEISQAVAGLEELSRRIPSAAEIAHELAFALLELAELTGEAEYYQRAIQALIDFENRQQGLYSRDVEVLCRWGRLWKDRGDQALEQAANAAAASGAEQKPQTPPAGATGSIALSPAQWYQMSATYYRRAYDASQDYYPGINLATLKYLISVLDPDTAAKSAAYGGGDYKKLPADIKRRLESDAAENKPEPEDAHWRIASLAEACLLLEDRDAETYYEHAWNHPRTVGQDAPHAREAIAKQARRIMTQQANNSPSNDLKDIHDALNKLFATI